MAFTQGSTESVGQLLSTSLYDFDFRKYAQAQGRWISPDPAGMAAADPTNPQSWNRYAYVLNNPLVNVDPLGLDCVYIGTDGGYMLKSGDCYSDQDNGYYVDGTVTDISYNQMTGNLGIGFNANDNGGWTFTSDANAVTSWQGPTGVNMPMPNDSTGSGTYNGSQNSGGNATSSGDVTTPGIEALFHTPETANIWKQANCVANKPFTTAGGDLKWATGGAIFVGASGAMHSGARQMLKAAGEEVSADVAAVGAIGGIYFHSLVATASSLVSGCKNDD